jgi:hypothetical protein
MFNDGDEWLPGGPEMYLTFVEWCGKDLCFRVAVFNFSSTLSPLIKVKLCDHNEFQTHSMFSALIYLISHSCLL